jgi:iron complex outermembrane receptor protein
VAGKAPNPEELYSQGPHAATGLFEVGDPRLQRERSTTAELGLLYRLEGFRLQLNLFTSRVRNFIYQTLTGEQEDGFPVAQFTQAKTRFWGGELTAHSDLLHVAEKHLELTLQGDVVRGELVDGPPLPRMAPGRVLGQLAFFDSRWRLALGAEKVFRATRTSPEETPTPGYTLLDLAISRRLVGEKRVHLVALQASNLLDAKAENHTSFFKEKSPLPGRSFKAVYQLWF